MPTYQQQHYDVLNDIEFMTDFILTMTDETEKKSLSYCILEHIKDHDKAVYKKDQAWYRDSLET
jgi:DNA repair exonuclease SbcCD nuclease subunit